MHCLYWLYIYVVCVLTVYACMHRTATPTRGAAIDQISFFIFTIHTMYTIRSTYTRIHVCTACIYMW